MFNFLESLDRNNSKKGLYFKIFLAPIWLLLEYICYKKYWKKIILPELVTNDEIFNFLNDNEFSLHKGIFIKKDLIDDNDFLSAHRLDECKNIIKKEFVEKLSKLITENCNTNIEEYISLTVNTDNLLSKTDGEVYSNRVYEVTIQYCRFWWLKKSLQYSIIWLILICILCVISYILFVLL